MKAEVKRMDQQLTFSNGSIFNNSYVIQVGKKLWVYVYDRNITFADLFYTLNNTAATETIIMTQGSTSQTFQGFNELFCLTKEDSGFMTAGLRKE